MIVRWIAGVVLVNLLFWVGSIAAYKNIEHIALDSHQRIMASGVDAVIAEIGERFPEELPLPGSISLAQIIRSHALRLGNTTRINIVKRNGPKCQVINQSFIKAINDNEGVIECTKLMLQSFLLGEVYDAGSKSFYGEDVHSYYARFNRFFNRKKRTYIVTVETYESEIRKETNKLFSQIVVGLAGVFILSVGFSLWGYRKAKQQRKAAIENQTTLENVTSGIARVDKNRLVVSANPAMALMFGYDSSDDLVGHKADMLFPDEHLEADVSSFHRMYAGTGTELDRKINLEGLRKDGGTFPVQITRHIVDFSGEPEVLKVFVDMTQEVEGRERIERKNEALRQFARVARHDLQNAVSPAALAIEYQIEAGYDEAAMEMAHGELQGAMKMFQDLSVWSKSIEADSYDIEKVDVDFTELVKGILIDGVKIDVEDLGTVHCNEGMMIAVVRNALENSVKYCPTQPRIRIYREDKNIYIEDNSGGFGCKEGVYDHEYAQRLTQPGQRGTSDVDGSGLGIANMIAMLQANDFKLTWQTECGKGTVWALNM